MVCGQTSVSVIFSILILTCRPISIYPLPFADIHTKLRDIVFAGNTVDSSASAAPQQACVREDAKKCLKNFMERYNESLSQETLRRRLENEKYLILEKYGTQARKPVKTLCGQVHFYEKDNIRYAIKVSKFNSNAGDDLGREARWCCAVSKDGNPTMLPSFESFALGNEFINVTPVATMGTLLSYLLDPQTDKTQLSKMFMDLLFAMSYLHNHMRVAHLDLKLENVFLGAGNQVIVGDFGVALAVANAERETAKKHLFQRQETVLQRRGASAQHIEQCKQREMVKFDALYDQNEKMQRSLSAILCASHQHVNGLISGLPPLTLPLHGFFRPSYQKHGFTYDKIKSINGYTDANDPQMDGSRLVDSFLAHLRPDHPSETALKEALATYTATLKRGLPAKLYAAANESSEVLTSAIQGRRGTEQYMCPVLWSGGSVNPFAADVYSLGVILYIFATGWQPYKSTSEQAFYELQRGGVAQLLKISRLTDHVHPTCLALLEKMMNVDPKQRPTIHECIKDFEGVEIYPFV